MGLKIASLSDSTSSAPQRLTLCMIVRDEEEHLPRCLDSVKGVVDEIVIVDTGSTDRTVAIAESHGAKIIHEEWTGDFAVHRNTSLDAATGDWIIVLDADEELVDGAALRPLLADPALEGYSLREINFIGQEAGLEAVVNAAFRVFRNRPAYRYEGALHEQIQAKVDPDGSQTTRFVGIEINHYGYLDYATDSRNKKARNMGIVLGEVKKKPNDAFTLFNAGVEFQRIDDHETALEYFKKAFINLHSMRQYFASLLVRNLVASLRALERHDEGLAVVKDGLAAYPDFPDLHYLQGQLYTARRDYRSAIASYRRAIDLGDHIGDRYLAQAGMGSFYSWFALGTLHDSIGDTAEAVRSYKLAITSAKGFYAPPLVRLAQLLVRDSPVDEVEAFLLGIIPATRRHDSLRVIAEVFATEGHPAPALVLLEKARALSADTHAIRVTMADCALRTGRPDEALVLLDQVPASSERSPFANSKRVLIGMVEGRPEVTRHGIAGLEGVADGSYATAYAMALAAQLEEPTGHVPAHQTPGVILGIVFELASTLLDIGAFDAFNPLIDLMYAIAGDPTDVHERLGLLFFTKGFTDPAADRLMQAVQAGVASPETFAAIGAICAEKDLDEDAENFLRAALEADDQNQSRYLGLASHLAGRGRYDEAGDVMREGLIIWPHSTVLRELRQSIGLFASVR